MTVPSRYDARRPTVSATIPVGTSNSTMPAVKNALAANASRFESPASSRKIVLIPQMNDAASVLPEHQQQVGALDGGRGGHAGQRPFHAPKLIGLVRVAVRRRWAPEPRDAGQRDMPGNGRRGKIPSS